MRGGTAAVLDFEGDGGGEAFGRDLLDDAVTLAYVGREAAIRIGSVENPTDVSPLLRHVVEQRRTARPAHALIGNHARQILELPQHFDGVERTRHRHDTVVLLLEKSANYLPLLQVVIDDKNERPIMPRRRFVLLRRWRRWHRQSARRLPPAAQF